MVLDCPHCGSERMGFAFGGETVGREVPIWNTLFTCRKCREGVVVKLRHPRSKSPSACAGDLRDDEFEMLAMYPKPQPGVAPEYVPDDIAADFVEAVDSLRRKAFTSAGMMFRRVLEQATRKTDPELGRERLLDRINTLAERHEITPAMKDWAHIIRIRGNEANHDDTFDNATAEQMHGFTELFLIYSFTLPGRVKRLRDQAETNT